MANNDYELIKELTDDFGREIRFIVAEKPKGWNYGYPSRLNRGQGGHYYSKYVATREEAIKEGMKVLHDELDYYEFNKADMKMFTDFFYSKIVEEVNPGVIWLLL